MTQVARLPRPPPLPQGIDRRSVAWCVDMCEAYSAWLAKRGRHVEANGALAAAFVLRSILAGGMVKALLHDHAAMAEPTDIASLDDVYPVHDVFNHRGVRGRWVA